MICWMTVVNRIVKVVSVWQADFVWLITAMQAYLMVLVEYDPVGQGLWKCASSNDTACLAIHDLEDLKDRKDSFCSLDPSQWEWSNS